MVKQKKNKKNTEQGESPTTAQKKKKVQLPPAKNKAKQRQEATPYHILFAHILYLVTPSRVSISTRISLSRPLRTISETLISSSGLPP